MPQGQITFGLPAWGLSGVPYPGIPRHPIADLPDYAFLHAAASFVHKFESPHNQSDYGGEWSHLSGAARIRNATQTLYELCAKG